MFTEQELELLDELVEKFILSDPEYFQDLKTAVSIQEKIDKELNGED